MPTPEDAIVTKLLLSEALPMALPQMQDAENTIDDGTILLARWATKRMQWGDISKPQTTIGRVKKDSAMERGKALCGAGSIGQIEAVQAAYGRVYIGQLVQDDAGVLAFIAVGSTGDLVDRSYARFCGIVTGRYTYSNAGGGTTHAVRVVGMFDLPENKTMSLGSATARPKPSEAQLAQVRAKKEASDECRERCVRTVISPINLDECIAGCIKNKTHPSDSAE